MGNDAPMGTAVRILLAGNGAFWLALGSFALIGAVDIGVTDITSRATLAALMVGNGAALALAAWAVLRGRRFVDVGAGLLLAVNTVLSVTDQIGSLDLVALTFNLGTLALLAVVAVRGPATGERS